MNLISRDELIKVLGSNLPCESRRLNRDDCERVADALLAIGHFERHEYIQTFTPKDLTDTHVEPDEWNETMQCKCGKEQP